MIWLQQFVLLGRTSPPIENLKYKDSQQGNLFTPKPGVELYE